MAATNRLIEETYGGAIPVPPQPEDGTMMGYGFGGLGMVLITVLIVLLVVVLLRKTGGN